MAHIYTIVLLQRYLSARDMFPCKQMALQYHGLGSSYGKDCVSWAWTPLFYPDAGRPVFLEGPEVGIEKTNKLEENNEEADCGNLISPSSGSQGRWNIQMHETLWLCHLDSFLAATTRWALI